MYRATSHIGDAVAVMIGGINGRDKIDNGKPIVELFVRYRPIWMPAIVGAEQMQGPWLPENEAKNRVKKKIQVNKH